MDLYRVSTKISYKSILEVRILDMDILTIFRLNYRDALLITFAINRPSNQNSKK